MKVISRALVLLTVLMVASSSFPPQAAAASPGFVIVTWGDTLYKVAVRNGTTVDVLVRANGLPNANFVYSGQRLVIPPANSLSAAAGPATASTGAAGVYVVSRGDTLASIAARYGTTISAMMRLNGLYNANFIFTGQRLNVPGSTAAFSVQSPSVPVSPPNPGNAPPAPTTGKWIDVNITTQTITAFQGDIPLKLVLVSTGVSWHPTPVGHFKIYLKVALQAMSGGVGAEAYYLPNVPWVMFFSGDNAIHGTYWHHNFGHPMSHGCVNLTIDDAKWFYDWAENGTPVISHL